MTNRSVGYALAVKLGARLLEKHLRLTVAESCTGGGLAAVITEVPGSSNWFDRGFVTYSNAAKEQMLAVPKDVLIQHGAVSEVTACAMARGAIAASDAQISAAITGIAGPDGGSQDKPVGTVWIAWAGMGKPPHSHCYFFEGDRASVRLQAVLMALRGLIERLN